MTATIDDIDVIKSPSFSPFSASGWPDNALDSVQQALADYDGDNLYEDVIVRLTGYDKVATALLEPVCAVPVFVASGIGYQWCSELGVWQAFDAAADVAEAMTDPLIISTASFLAGRRPRQSWGRNARRGWRRFVPRMS